MPGIVPATRFDQVPNLEMRFPPLPHTMVEVSQLLAENRDNPDTQGLVDAINRDPVVATTVLRRINSAFYGMRRMVADLRKAVFLLGFLEVSNLVMTSALLKLREVLTSEEQVHMFNQIMRISVTTAYYTQEIARTTAQPNAPIAFTAGLLHSVGRLVLLYNKPHDYEALWCTSDSGVAPSVEAERVIFGTDHARLAALAADRWNLPGDIITVIGSYLDPTLVQDPGLRILAHTIALSAEAAERSCAGEELISADELPETLVGFAREADMTPAEVVDLLECVHATLPDSLEELLQAA